MKEVSLEQLLRNNRLVWRGRGGVVRPERALRSGFAALDSVLPEGGWPQHALMELVLPQWGSGELQLLLPAMQRASRDGLWVVWVAPPYVPYAPALSAAGIDLQRVLLLRPTREQDIPWAMEKALRQSCCAMVLAWPGRLKPVMVRRLQLAAEAGQSLGVLMLAREPGRSAAALRLRLSPRLSSNGQGVRVTILKSRAASVRREIDVDFHG